jgi:hypothetical protein
MVQIDDERLKAVTDHVHAWLFPLAKAVEGTTEAPSNSLPKTSHRLPKEMGHYHRREVKYAASPCGGPSMA